MGSTPDVVMLVTLFWQSEWRNKQNFAVLLARDRRVLYCNQPLPLLSREGLRALFLPRVTEPRPNLRVVQPLTLRRGTGRLICAINDRLYLRSVRRAMRAWNMRRPLLHIFLPSANVAIGALGEVGSVYHCSDLWRDCAAFDRWWITPREVDMVRRASAVVACSSPLQEEWRARRPDTVLIENGVDIDLFSRATLTEIQVAPELAALPQPVIGFAGGVSGRIDFALWREVALSLPSTSFVFLGDITADYERFPGEVAQALSTMPANVHVLGRRPREALPSYLKGMAVGAIPYTTSSFNEASFPLKLYEYLAAGLPVVSTPLPAVTPSPNDIFVATDSASFTEAVRQATAAGGARAVARRQALARANSWEQRLPLLLDVFERVAEQENA